MAETKKSQGIILAISCSNKATLLLLNIGVRQTCMSAHRKDGCSVNALKALPPTGCRGRKIPRRGRKFPRRPVFTARRTAENRCYVKKIYERREFFYVLREFFYVASPFSHPPPRRK